MARDDHAGVTDQYRALKRERDALVSWPASRGHEVDEARRVVERAQRFRTKASNRPRKSDSSHQIDHSRRKKKG